ncbi:hypothetical protein HMPREF0666_02336 [Prevotella sp. C561]|nr:hypothetical protein HMPREF0666_02336 [Prevotella sp. C561]
MLQYIAAYVYFTYICNLKCDLCCGLIALPRCSLRFSRQNYG